jgi:hypothetical protein
MAQAPRKAAILCKNTTGDRQRRSQRESDSRSQRGTSTTAKSERGATHYIHVLRPANPYHPSPPETFDVPSASRRNSGTVVGSPPQKTGSPEPVSCDRLRPFRDRRLNRLSRQHGT